MKHERIIIGIGILIGLSFYKKIKPSLLIGILIGLIFSFLLSFSENQILINISFISFGVLSLIFTIYNGLKKKWLNLIVGVFVPISFLFKYMNYPYENELRLLMIIPILSFILAYRKWKTDKSELSILSIFVAYELTEFLQIIKLWID